MSKKVWDGMGYYMEQRLAKQIASALETYSVTHQGEVAFTKILDRDEVFRGTQKPGLIIKAVDGTTYQIKIEPTNIHFDRHY
ncbi:hypothetical protein [Litchfieldia alkalitelluris]|uniref:hypothetical protein n=1 Tax=Litchfieldia alkalitelluris TaxID=304268 RepID=UPI0019581D64|nr:hypothetical protein [Litchfieldia alkalitelluris]